MGERLLTMESSVKTLALKFYGEQLVNTFGTDEQKSAVNGFSTIIKEYAEQLGKPDNGTDYKQLIKQKNEELTEYVKSIIQPIEEAFYENIRKYDKSYAQVICIKHDRDYNSDNVWEPSIEKPHYHLIMRTVTVYPFKVKMILSNPKTSKRGIVEYRKELDDVLFDKSGVQTIGDFQKYTVYLTHETEEAERDGKERYEITELISNMDLNEIELIRDGYKQVSRVYVKPKDAREADKIAYELGTKLKSFEDWYASLPFDMRKMNQMKTIRESYDRGVDEAISYAKEIDRVCIFITGVENQGKSYSSVEALKKLGVDPKYIFKVTDGTGKYDGLTVKHKAIIVDDTISPSLLHLADTKPCKVYRRNKGNGVWCGDYFIVCTNLDIYSWAKKCGIDDANYKAFFSRFNVISVEGEKVELLSRMTRGEQIAFRVKEKVDKFLSAFIESRKNFNPVGNVRPYMDVLQTERLYNIFKTLLVKYPVVTWRINLLDEHYIIALSSIITYQEIERLKKAIGKYYATHPYKAELAKNTYSYIPQPSIDECFASLYGYDTSDIDKEFEELLYEEDEYMSSVKI